MHRSIPVLAIGTLLLSAATAGAQARAAAGPRAGAARAHDGLQRGPAPAVFPAGAQMAVVAGNPHGEGVFTVRLRMPDGYRIPPHTHPTDEYVTVLQGNLAYGMGATVAASSMNSLQPGGFVALPSEHPHYVRARGETIVQVHALGPFALKYVDPADDPTGRRER